MGVLEMVFMGCLLTGVFYAVAQLLLGGLGQLTDSLDIGGDAGGHGIGFDHGGDGLSLDHGGDAFSVDHGGVDSGDAGPAHGDADGHSMSPINGLTVSAFVTGFGGFGMIARYFGWSPVNSVIFALSSALLMALAVFLLFIKLFVSVQGSSHYRRIDLLGRQAEVIVSLEETRMGTVAYIMNGARQTSPAISESGRSIPRGTPVEIVRISDGTVYVREREG